MQSSRNICASSLQEDAEDDAAMILDTIRRLRLAGNDSCLPMFIAAGSSNASLPDDLL